MQTRKRHLQVALPGANSVTASESHPSSKYEAIFEHVSDAIFTVRTGGAIDAMNWAAAEMTGFMKEELVGRSICELAPIPERHKIPARTRALDLGLFAMEGRIEEVAILRKDGFVTLVDLSVRQVDSGITVAILRDVTEKKRMERDNVTKHNELRNAFVDLEKANSELKATQEILVQAGKMAALGELAAGIAHELNQPLMGIRGYAQEMQHFLSDSIPDSARGTEARLAMGEIISSADKMAQIIKHLRVFTRKSTEDFEMVDVKSPIEEALKLVSRQLASRGIEIVREYAADAPLVYANPLQLEQVFINLTTNARDAIEAKGIGKGKIQIRTRRHGDFAEIEFQDDGIGMSEKTKAKAFNPFFTTKEVGQGMGLGLSLSYGMISKIHGSVRVESAEGRGTIFTIQIPVDFRELG